MMVANSFDLWQKDAFFSAAEEVQESADVMESTYRAWVRESKEGLALADLDELCREVQTALGTAKWQLEEFDRAVRLSHRNRSEDSTTTRHRQFVAAIESQISRVEVALREYFNEDVKQPLQWVSLDEEERDDLAIFLSGTSGTLLTAKDESVKRGCLNKNSVWEKQHCRKDANLDLSSVHHTETIDERKGFKDIVTINKDTKYVIELEAKEMEDINSQDDRATGSRRTWSSPNIGDWKIVIADEDEQGKTSMSSIEATPKDKGSKPFLWKQRCGDHSLVKGRIQRYIQLGGISRISQLFRRVGMFQRNIQGPLHLQLGCSVQLMLALMLTIFLIVPFVFYSA